MEPTVDPEKRISPSWRCRRHGVAVSGACDRQQGGQQNYIVLFHRVLNVLRLLPTFPFVEVVNLSIAVSCIWIEECFVDGFLKDFLHYGITCRTGMHTVVPVSKSIRVSVRILSVFERGMVVGINEASLFGILFQQPVQLDNTLSKIGMGGIPLLALPPDPVGRGRRANDYLETSCSACFGHQTDVCENSFDRAGLSVVFRPGRAPAGDDHARRIVDNYVVVKRALIWREV